MPAPIARRSLLGAAGLALPLAASAGGAARAQGAEGGGTAAGTAASWPNRPVRIVVPFPPGGSNDAVARPLAEKLQARFGQPFVIENRPGAGSTIGTDFVAKSPPDGHTLLVTSSSFATSAAVQRTPYDAARDFDAVALLATAPLLLVGAPDFPAHTVRDVVRLAKERPGRINYGSSGPGGINHLSMARFCLATGIELTHIPYRGMGPAATDLAAGNVQLIMTTLASVAGLVRDGRIRAICYTDEGRPEGTPDAPTARQGGVDFEASLWWGLLAPRGLPAPVRQALNAATNEALTDPGLARYLAGEGAVPAPRPADAWNGMLLADVARWREVATRANIRIE